METGPSNPTHPDFDIDWFIDHSPKREILSMRGLWDMGYSRPTGPDRDLDFGRGSHKRDTVAQLDNFVSSTVGLLNALGKPGGKCFCPSVNPNEC